MTATLDHPAEFDQARFDAGRFDGFMEIIDATGDTKIMWDKSNPDEVAMAKAAFETAQAKGMSIFRAEGKSGEQGERIEKFDKKHERLIAIPAMAGG